MYWITSNWNSRWNFSTLHLPPELFEIDQSQLTISNYNVLWSVNLGNMKIKKTLAQVFSCEFCEIFKNTFLYRTPPVAGSIISLIAHVFSQWNPENLHWSTTNHILTQYFHDKSYGKEKKSNHFAKILRRNR